MKIKGIEEKELIKRLFDGDQIAFELIFRFYYPGLVIFARQIVLDPDDAEEIVEDFFVHIWEKRRNIKTSASIKSYLFTSIKNRSLNLLKRKQIKEKVIKELKHLVEIDFLYQPDLFIESELQNKIAFTLQKLPTRTHEIFSLSRLDSLSNAEIAEKLNLSKRTVETQISNALKIFRIELKDYLFLLLILTLNGF